MNKNEIDALRAEKVGDIAAKFDDMATADIKALIAEEGKQKSPRQDLIDNAQAYLIARLESEVARANEHAAAAKKAADAANESGGADASPKEARGEQVKEHLKPEYTGPISAAQALERNRRMKVMEEGGKGE